MTLRTAIRPRRCAYCKQQYMPTLPMQKACSLDCAKGMAPSMRAKAEKRAQVLERKRDREARERIKPRAKWLKEAEHAVNRYVRLRDAHLGCVSCDKPASWGGQWHASHFRSVGAASAVRFHLWNIHKACSVCNKHLSGNLAEYEPRLRALIGSERVDWLRSQNHLADYPIEYLSRLKRLFNRKANRLEKRLGL